MAKYLRTSSITAELENLIRDAKKVLYIISPYLKLSDNVKELLNDKEREKVDVRIIFGKQELAPAEMSYLENLKYVRLYFSKNLHAKCYLNENKMIIASMNLYEFSQQNNREMGILIDTALDEDKVVYEDALKDIDSIIHNSEDFSYAKVPQKKLQKEASQESIKSKLRAEKKDRPIPKSDNNGNGHCIRCNKSIKLNPLVPYCKDCYKIWNKYGDEEYSEEYCHICGTKKETTMLKPTCYPCYKANKNKLEFNV